MRICQAMALLARCSSAAAHADCCHVRGARAAPGCEPGRDDVCAAYPETQSCAGTGFGLCSFDFRSSSGQMIEIVTHGAAVGKLTVSEVIECRSSGCD